MSITSIMHEDRTFPPDPNSEAYVKGNEYDIIYRKSIEDPENFWSNNAQQLHWFKPWSKTFKWDKEKVKFEWFIGGKLNASYNCLDRHLKKNGNKIAIIWQGEPEDDVKKITFSQLHEQVCKFANVLKSKGLIKGDRVCMYMPMIPELAIATLACARLGLIHSIVFAGFSAESLKDRILDSKCKTLITADGGFRGGKILDLKSIADEAINKCDCIEHVIVAERVKNNPKMGLKDSFWNLEMNNVNSDCPAIEMDSEDPLFILYTSGTTGTPKGVLHTTGGYLTYVYQTFKWIFDYKEGDVYWCTADLGWITGHSYIIYGPLANGATTLIFEGTPTYPDVDRFWSVVEKFKVNQFYTAPTAIRAIMRFGNAPVHKHDLSSLKILGTVGEPINPEAWIWYHQTIGNEKCPIVDTWWQTETGGVLITPLPGSTILKPGSATKPFPGIEPGIYREDGTEANPNEGGYLVIKKPWPGLMRTVYGDHQRYIDTYWSKFKDIYLAGDSARKDHDGDYWIMGRVDDVINVSGHRLGTAEIESALVSHPKVAESAVVPIPHEIKGQALYAFVTLNKDIVKSTELIEELRLHVAKQIGAIAKPDIIQFTDILPKTRSGKIMRRILKAIAEGKDDVGNTTTLADPSVVDSLLHERG